MCRLADLRFIAPYDGGIGLPVMFYEVDEDGQLTGEADLGFLPSKLAAPEPVPEFMCQACGQELGSWLEAKLHIEDGATKP